MKKKVWKVLKLNKNVVNKQISSIVDIMKSPITLCLIIDKVYLNMSNSLSLSGMYKLVYF